MKTILQLRELRETAETEIEDIIVKLQEDCGEEINLTFLFNSSRPRGSKYPVWKVGIRGEIKV